jgi:tetratricopeptide (TPR) repeat protein
MERGEIRHASLRRRPGFRTVQGAGAEGAVRRGGGAQHRPYGRLLYEESRLEEALAQFERALGIDRFDGAAYYGICLVNAAWGNYPNAVSHCELALAYGTRPVWGVSRQELVRYIDQLRAKSAEQREAHQDEQRSGTA